MIGVVIPSYFGGARLLRCVSSLKGQIKHETFVRNNDEDNILYTRAINEGLRHFLAKRKFNYFLVLTQDCYLSQHCLFNLKQTLLANPRAGIASPAQLDSNGRTTWAGSLDCWPSGIHVTNKLSDFSSVPAKTYWPNGAAFMITRHCLETCGLLDEGMRFICSDADYGLTVRSRGYDVLMVPEAQAEHVCDESAKISNPWLQKIKTEDALFFTEKWLSGDLFRKLSYEGPNISAGHVAEFIRLVKLKLTEVT